MVLIVQGESERAAQLAALLRDRPYGVRAIEPTALIDQLQLGADLVLLALSLPGVDSLALCRHIKTVRPLRDIPIVVVGNTEDCDGEEAAQAFGAGANEYLPWPSPSPAAIARIEQQITLYRRRQHMSQQNAMLLQEVRERQEAEKALKDAEARYRSIFENANEGIFQITEDGRYLEVNPALAQIYGYSSPEDLITHLVSVQAQLYVQPKRWDELVVYLRQFGKIVGAESAVRRRDGTEIWVSETIRKVVNDTGDFLYYEGIVHDTTERHLIDMELRQQRQQADRLLVNILPYQIAQRLKAGTRTIAENFEDVTVLFADLVDFTAAASQMDPKDLVNLLNQIFSTFDRLAEHYQLEKIKTIGDAYMAAGGLPVLHPDHVDAVALMALDMQEAMGKFHRPDGSLFRLRIGIHTGSVIAGVIGRRKFAYDLWGDTVNLASRMESTGLPGRIQVSGRVNERLKSRFILEPRGTIAVKGGGLIDTYWLVGRR